MVLLLGQTYNFVMPKADGVALHGRRSAVLATLFSPFVLGESADALVKPCKPDEPMSYVLEKKCTTPINFYPYDCKTSAEGESDSKCLQLEQNIAEKCEAEFRRGKCIECQQRLSQGLLCIPPIASLPGVSGK